jgi:hypothetical protein
MTPAGSDRSWKDRRGYTGGRRPASRRKVSTAAEITLRNGLGSGPTADVMRFRVTGRGRDDSRIPQRLSRIEPLRADRAVRTRTWTFRRAPTGEHPGWLLDGRAFDPDRAVLGVGARRLHPDAAYSAVIPTGVTDWPGARWVFRRRCSSGQIRPARAHPGG